MSLEFLYLNEADMIQAGVLDIKRCVQSMDDLFRLMGKGDYLMGGSGENSHGIKIFFPEKKRTEKMPIAGPDRRFMAMPAYLGGRFYVCGQKWYGSNIENTKKGLPRSILTVMINDVDTGAPLALMSANLLSAARTGAVPGVATKYLQSSKASTIGIIGAGVISRSCLLAISETIAVKGDVRVYDLFYDKAEAFCKEIAEQTGLNVYPVDSLEKAVRDCDIVSIAAAGKVQVFIPDEWIKPGAVIEVTGAVKLSDESYIKNHVVMDNWKMHEEWYQEFLQKPEQMDNENFDLTSTPLFRLLYDGRKKVDDIDSLGEIIEKPELGRKDDKETFIFITGGMPTEDVAWGCDVYRQAQKLGIGQKLKLWDKPHWA
ncbi:MAG: tyramine oxidase subunit B [Clostridiaceae bacterium]|nr:tyramine oxidase subunit B [Clostridiaceae bacterium]